MKLQYLCWLVPPCAWHFLLPSSKREIYGGEGAGVIFQGLQGT